jgi:glycosyltransferase involved in cell wall biosynthesis
VRRLRSEADRLGVADRVRFVGPVARDDVAGLMLSADVVACTPWYEPFGIVPLEAMACARPVVGAAVGGLLDTVVDGVTGLLVPPRDPVRLAAALRELLADPARRERLGRAGAARVRRNYTWPRVAAATEEIYRRIGASVISGRVS